MKKYIILGIIGISVFAIIGVAVYLNGTEKDEQTSNNKPATTVTSSTTATTKKPDDSSTEDTASWWNQDKPEQSSSSGPKTSTNRPTYQPFSVSSFKAAAGTTRILFFYDQSHEPSTILDTVLKAHASELPKDIYVFKVSYTEEPELAKDLSVTQPGTVLKYDTKNNLSGIYIAMSSPDMTTFRKALTID